MFGGTHEQKFASTLANFVHLSLSSYYVTKNLAFVPGRAACGGVSGTASAWRIQKNAQHSFSAGSGEGNAGAS